MLQVMRPSTRGRVIPKESVCEVRTQDPENFDEEVLALVSAWCHAYPYGRGDYSHLAYHTHAMHA